MEIVCLFVRWADVSACRLEDEELTEFISRVIMMMLIVDRIAPDGEEEEEESRSGVAAAAEWRGTGRNLSEPSLPQALTPSLILKIHHACIMYTCGIVLSWVHEQGTVMQADYRVTRRSGRGMHDDRDSSVVRALDR